LVAFPRRVARLNEVPPIDTATVRAVRVPLRRRRLAGQSDKASTGSRPSDGFGEGFVAGPVQVGEAALES